MQIDIVLFILTVMHRPLKYMGEEVVREVACPPIYGKNKYDYSGLTLIYKKTT